MILEWFPILILFIFGLPIGSFLNVVIWRVPRNENIAFPPSHCPTCNTKIKPWDNIPILSYLILGGKCRNCGSSISIRYPIIEFITAILFAIAWPLTGSAISWELFGAIILTGFGISITVIDIEYRIIPDELSMSALLLGLILTPLRTHSWAGLGNAAIGILVGGILFLIIRILGRLILKKEAMGFGDVKLMAMVGAFVGWKGVLLTTLTGSLLGTVICSLLMIFNKKLRKNRVIPFGPFLVAGSLISYYFGNQIIEWYLQHFLAM